VSRVAPLVFSFRMASGLAFGSAAAAELLDREILLVLASHGTAEKGPDVPEEATDRIEAMTTIELRVEELPQRTAANRSCGGVVDPLTDHRPPLLDGRWGLRLIAGELPPLRLELSEELGAETVELGAIPASGDGRKRILSARRLAAGGVIREGHHALHAFPGGGGEPVLSPRSPLPPSGGYGSDAAGTRDRPTVDALGCGPEPFGMIDGRPPLSTREAPVHRPSMTPRLFSTMT
jgi:hypothetical protein